VAFKPEQTIPPLFFQNSVKAVVSWTSIAADGNARHPATLQKILQRQHLPTSIALAEQVHGDKIAVVPALSELRQFKDVDGLLTSAVNQPLGIFTADCVPVFLYARQKGVIGLLHAGWRGVYRKILPKAMRLLKTHWAISSTDLEVWMGPSIGGCCFEVGWDVACHFPLTRVRKEKKWFVDLQKELQMQGIQKGLSKRRVILNSLCTMESATSFSYRKTKTNDRLLSLLMRKS